MGERRGFAVEVGEDGRAVVVHVSGEVDLACAEQLRDAIVAASAEHPGAEIVLRLGGLTFLDARGMAALVEASGTLARQGASLVVADVPPFIRRLLQIADMGAVLDIR